MFLIFLKPLLLLIFIFSCSPSIEAKSFCSQLFSQKKYSQYNYQQAQKISHEVALTVEKGMEPAGIKKSSVKGYAVLVGTMVGSAVLTTYVGARLPSNLQFASIFLSQVTVLGVYVLGAPIWEPISSQFRKWAFGIKSRQIKDSYYEEGALENLWGRTQESYSLNAQMSRNVINQFILAVKQNFYFAHRAYIEKNPEYSADQVAEAAYRMRLLFKDIQPNDPSVAAAINSTFTNHIKINGEFRDLVWERLKVMDSHLSSPDVFLYYDVIIKTWLTEN